MLLLNSGVVCRGGAEGENESALEFEFSAVSLLRNGESKGACSMISVEISSSGGAEGAILEPLSGGGRTDRVDGVGIICELEFLWACNFRIFVKLSYCLLIDGECFIMRRASLIKSLYRSGAFAITDVFSVSCSLDGFMLWKVRKCL